MTVPPPKTLQVTLRKLTETLARALADPNVPTPNWSDFEWIAARAVAAMHGVSPLLSRVLRWEGPAGWHEFLRDQRQHTAKRHERITALLRQMDRATIDAGIPVLALKGAALHALGYYVPGDRPMADVDILVKPKDADAAARCLESIGFRQTSESWKERVFTPLNEHAPDALGEHANNDLKIELHDRICERLPWHLTDAAEDIFPSEAHAGLNAYPSKAALMLHLVLHAAGCMPSKILRLLQLHDIALVSAQMSQADWDRMLAAPSADKKFWWAFPPLKLTARYYPSAIPVSVLARLAGECPLLLRNVASQRQVHDVSYSYLWVDAFPGIEWSQSVPKAVAYAANRLWPRASMIASRQVLADNQIWAQQGEWAKLSQARRMLRWLSSRPARPVTMHAVLTALSHAF
jgi:hypothetical protein